MKRSVKLAIACALVLVLHAARLAAAEWPMSNDPGFDPGVASPAFPASKGPTILLDKAHHNFFVQQGFIQPFAELAKADGFRPVIGDERFTPGYLAQYDIVMIITALPFDFTTKVEVTTETTFTDAELTALHEWVAAGGSLLVFSEHAPFDQAINPLLKRFGITSSVGTIADPEHYDKDLGREGWITFTRENGLLNTVHPIVSGRNKSESIDRLITFGGGSLSGKGYTSLFRLSPTAENRRHPTGVGPSGMGDSQALVGAVGKGKIAAFGDSNGFTAMVFAQEDGTSKALGMNTANYDWKPFVLNVLRWLAHPAG
jgi:hypothetical protein